MRTWCYRICRQNANPSYGEYEYSIREHYGEFGYTDSPIPPTGESLEDLKWALEKMLEAVNDAINDPEFVLEDTE